MNERLKKLRKSILKISQEEMGKRLGVGKTAISKIEKGENNLTEPMKKLICREFNVNYMWLDSGYGEMFDTSDDDTLALIERYMAGENEIAKSVFKNFAKLNEDEWKVIEKLLEDLSNKKHK